MIILLKHENNPPTSHFQCFACVSASSASRIPLDTFEPLPISM